ncbi:Flagellar hook-length control protein FliK [hydrothermal vent metagenome]|uniref:Flagellar hook-length control protein FliK n=1 Tax=hydrothermal vent metagenome TaxID=652676 RepID=A0A3B1AE51_9ZZZZ
MSDTAVSSQIALDVNAGQKAMASSAVDKKSVSSSQGSEFKEILNESQQNKIKEDSTEQTTDVALESGEVTELPPELLNLNALFSTTVLANSQSPGLSGAAISGNLLPARQQANSLLTNMEDALAASKLVNSGLNSGVAQSNLTEANPLLASQLGMNSGLLTDDGLFTAQLTANFTEASATNLKQLNAQMMSQALIKTEPVLDQNLPTSAQSSLMFNQAFALKPAESMLPAMTVTPDNAQWNNQVGERINWMVNSQMQRAEIRLDPPELGSLDIRLNIAKDNQASVVFYVSNASAKEAIESAIPRLREMLAQQGLDLANVDVSQQSFQQQQQSAFEQYSHHDSDDALNAVHLNGARQSDDESILAITNLSTENSDNLLDIFA